MERRVLVVGLGLRGLQWADQIRRSDDMILVGGVDPDEQARRASHLPGDRCFETFTQAAALDLDAVVVASSADRHVDAAVAALEMGKAVLIEKPLATSLEDALSITRVAESKNLPVVVAQNYRYMRAHRTARRLIAEGAIGRVGIVKAHYYRTPHEMAPSLAASDDPILWGMAVHHLDALRHVLGREAVSVIADLSSQPGTDLKRGATIRALLDLEDGIRVDYTATYESRGHEYFGGGQEFYERFIGDEATLHVFHRWLFLCRGRRLPRPIGRGKRGVTEEMVLLRQLFESLETGLEPECSARDNLGTMAILDACLRSSKERRWVDVRVPA